MARKLSQKWHDMNDKIVNVIVRFSTFALLNWLLNVQKLNKQISRPNKANCQYKSRDKY
jgi:hypothetical protein